MYDGKTDLVAGIIDKLLIYGKASIELLDKVLPVFVGKSNRNNLEKSPEWIFSNHSSDNSGIAEVFLV